MSHIMVFRVTTVCIYDSGPKGVMELKNSYYLECRSHYKYYSIMRSSHVCGEAAVRKPTTMYAAGHMKV